MMKLVVRIAIFSTTFVVLPLTAAEPDVAREHSTDPMDWLIQHVCADGADKPVSADPYDGCPAGAHERRLKIGDPMPYVRHDMPGRNGSHPHGFQRRDAYPLVDLHYGGIISANDADFDYSTPYGRVKPGDGDGFDVFRVWRGYATGGGTRDGAGYSQTFFGPECKPFGGWVFFPVSFLEDLRAGAEAGGVFPVRGDRWEQEGAPWPGRCEPGKGFSTTTTTQWSFEPAHRFGGVNGAKTKIMDAIVSTFGLPVSPAAQPHYHLERFFFTDMYGLTRFEGWFPKGRREPNPACAANPEMTYRGIKYVATQCRDWSATEILDPPRERFPWPYPEINLLSNWHFDQETLAPWRSEEPAQGGHSLELTIGASHSALDTRFAPRGGGVRFLEIGCPGGCAGDSVIYQDIPVERLGGATRFDYGFSAVADGAGPGAMTASLSLRDGRGQPLWSDSFTATVQKEYRGKTTAESVYKASGVYLHISPTVPELPNAESLRITLSTTAGVQLNVLDAWLMPRL
jgi:hypothetical protein